MVKNQVGVGGDVDGLASHPDRFGVASLGGEDLSPYRPPGDGALEVVAGDAFALRGVTVGLLDAPLRQHRPRQQCRGLPGVGADAQRIQPFQRGPEVGFGRGRVTEHQIHDPGVQLGLHQTVAQAEFGHDLPGIGEHPPGLLGPSAQQFQHRQATQRRRLQRRRGGRHPLHPNDVQTPPAGLWRRARTPQGGVGCRAQCRGDLAMVTGLAGRDQGLEQSASAVPMRPNRPLALARTRYALADPAGSPRRAKSSIATPIR